MRSSYHENVNPVELVDRIILALSNENDVVLNPYGGVGSTLISAVKNKRKAISVEKERKYCEIAMMRLELLKKGELKIRPATKKIHTPKNTDKTARIPGEWVGNGVY